MTIKQFVRSCGGSMAAAFRVGVHITTMWRWETGKRKPTGNNAKILRDLGVKW